MLARVPVWEYGRRPELSWWRDSPGWEGGRNRARVRVGVPAGVPAQGGGGFGTRPLGRILRPHPWAVRSAQFCARDFVGAGPRTTSQRLAPSQVQGREWFLEAPVSLQVVLDAAQAVWLACSSAILDCALKILHSDLFRCFLHWVLDQMIKCWSWSRICTLCMIHLN